MPGDRTSSAGTSGRTPAAVRDRRRDRSRSSVAAALAPAAAPWQDPPPPYEPAAHRAPQLALRLVPPIATPQSGSSAPDTGPADCRLHLTTAPPLRARRQP